MRVKLIVFFLFTSIAVGFSQKPVLSLDSYKQWPDVGSGELSTDGHYTFYVVRNFPVGKNTFILKSTASGKELLSLINIKNPAFSIDSRYVAALTSGDSLLVFDIRNLSTKYIGGIHSFELRIINGKQRLVCTTKAEELIFYDFEGNKRGLYQHLSQFTFSPGGDKLILEQKDTTAQKKVVCKWIDTATGKETTIYSGNKTSNAIFDVKGCQAAFMVLEDSSLNVLYHYEEKSDKAHPLIRSRSFEVNGMDIETGDYWAFSFDSQRLFFSLREVQLLPLKSVTAPVEIWNYKDAYIRTFYDGPAGGELKQKRYLATVTVNDAMVCQLWSGNQKLLRGTLKLATDSICVVQSANGLLTEPWNPNSAQSYFICDTKTGKLLPLETNMTGQILSYSLSPAAKFFVYFHPVLKKYLSYDLSKRARNEIARDIDANLGQVYREHYPDSLDAVGGISGWLDGDSLLLIQSAFDVWKADPRGLTPSHSITGRLGEKQKTVYYILRQNVDFNGKILLGAFNIKNKNYGFAEADLKSGGTFKTLSSGNFYLGTIKDLYTKLYPPDFIPSRKGYLLRLQKADEYPNYFYSEDLRSFKPLSDFQPQKKFNWLTAELHSYRDSLGTELQGLLYKPENFAPEKRYPIVFAIYETKSNFLNGFVKPDLSGVNINPAVLASNGYLVFTPDIKGRIGRAGQAALSSILAAVQYLSQFNWADISKMAIMGHSFGGFETNYIVTHSTAFAAAIPSAGVSNMITEATSQWGSGEVKQYFEQYGPTMMGSTLSENINSYIENSPILNARNVKTPILFMHNDKDRNVSHQQTQSFFIMLRSLGKPCWWLNYKGMEHGVVGEKNQLDYNTRVWQFLDHFLKGKPMPDWMSEHL